MHLYARIFSSPVTNSGERSPRGRRHVIVMITTESYERHNTTGNFRPTPRTTVINVRALTAGFNVIIAVIVIFDPENHRRSLIWNRRLPMRPTTVLRFFFCLHAPRSLIIIIIHLPPPTTSRNTIVVVRLVRRALRAPAECWALKRKRQCMKDAERQCGLVAL